jgi:hypothetical protein
VALYFVNQSGDVGIPDANFMVESCAEQQYHSLVEGQTQYSSRVLFINPFFLRINRVPEDQLAVHSSRSHELQLGHSDHAGNQHVYLLFTFIFFAASGLGQNFLEVCFEVPHADSSTFLPAV